MKSMNLGLFMYSRQNSVFSLSIPATIVIKELKHCIRAVFSLLFRAALTNVVSELSLSGNSFNCCITNSLFVQLISLNSSRMSLSFTKSGSGFPGFPVPTGMGAISVSLFSSSI